MTVKTEPALPLSDDDFARLDNLLMVLRDRHDDVPPLETLDGFLTALACGPRVILREEYLPVLLGIAQSERLGFADMASEKDFLGLLDRRAQQIVAALSAPVDNLDDQRALQPALTDWAGAREDLQAGVLTDADREALENWPLIGEPWANGFLLAVDHWSEEWELPAGDEDEFVNDCLAAFEVLVLPEQELEPDQREAIRDASRDDLVGEAIWAAYDLRRFWQAWLATQPQARPPSARLH